MELRIGSGDLYVSAWMQSFVATTVQFAIWHATPGVEQVSVRFARSASGEVGCHLEAWRSDGSTVRAAAWAARAFDAVQTAADLLEVALFPSPGSDDRESEHPARVAV